MLPQFECVDVRRGAKGELEREGVTTRQFVSASNRSWGNRPFSIGHLRSILQNPIYVGEVRHRDERYPAQHPSIIDREQFDRVQALISARARRHRMRLDAQHINLLSGLLYDPHGNRFTCSHTNKKGVRYRYYVAPVDGQDTSSPTRISAGALEQLVLDAVTEKLRNRQWLQANIVSAGASPNAIASTMSAARDAAETISGTDAQIVHLTLTSIVSRIDIHGDAITIDLKPEKLLPGAIDSDDQKPAHQTVTVANPFTVMAQSRHLIVKREGPGAAEPSSWMVKALARSSTWYNELVSGASSVQDIATREGVSARYVRRLVPLAFLDPRLVRECVEGETALSLTASDLTDDLELPALWADQNA